MAKLKLISASVNSLNFKPSEPASHLKKLIQAHEPAHEITPKTEAINMVINFINTDAARVHKHDYYIPPAPQKHALNSNRNSNNSKYLYNPHHKNF